MDTTRFIVFFSVLMLLQVGLDYYTLRNWKKYVLERKYSLLLYRIPQIFGILMFFALPYVFWHRYEDGLPTTLTILLSMLVAFWYIPKVPIVLVLFLRDIFRFFRWIYTRFYPNFSKKNPSEEITSVKRRELLQNVGWSLAGAPFLVLGNGITRTLYDFDVQEVEIPLRNLHRAFDGFRIAQISDIHAGSFISRKPIAEIVRRTQSLKADMIVITGDWVNFQPEELSLILPDFAKFSAPFGVYGSLGNHDHYMSDKEHAQLIAAIRSTRPISLLINENISLKADGAILQLAATDYEGMGQNFADLSAAMNGLSPENPTVLLAHDPKYWDKSVRGKAAVDLILSGHTHGGQLGVHILDREYSFAQLVYKQWAGLYSDAGQFLYVNRGIGTTGFPVRVGISPEITHFTLRRTVA